MCMCKCTPRHRIHATLRTPAHHRHRHRHHPPQRRQRSASRPPPTTNKSPAAALLPVHSHTTQHQAAEQHYRYSPTMAARSSSSSARFLLQLLAVAAVMAAVAEAGFDDNFEVVGARDHIHYRDDGKNGQEFALTLDRESGSGFKSRDKYLFGEFSVQMQLVGGNSAGTVTSFYLTSGEGDTHDEIDIEFMGNKSGDPYVMNTNVWAAGDGKKEHQFYLWFDPAADYHTYKITWNPKNIIFEVDGVPVRTFKKYDDLPFPSSKPMTVHATLWDGSYWATRHGEVKVHWREEPFLVAYRGYHADGCVHSKTSNSSSPSSFSHCPAGSDAWMHRELGAEELRTVAWAERNCLSYNYCADGWRFPKGFPGECARE